MTAAPVSVWSRFVSKFRWSNWQQQQHSHVRYEYPDAHRQPPSPAASRNIRNNNSSNNASESSGGVLDPEELLPYPYAHSLRDHPLHQGPFDAARRQLAHALIWTTIHAGVMYVFWFHIKPRIVRFFHSRVIKSAHDSDDDDDDDDVAKAKLPTGKRTWLPFSKNNDTKKKRLCCCCDEMVSAKNNFCPRCGAPTCATCAYCGAGIQTDDKFCNSCGQAIANHVVVDGGPLPRQLSRRQSSSSSTTTTNNNNMSHGNRMGSPLQQQQQQQRLVAVPMTAASPSLPLQQQQQQSYYNQQQAPPPYYNQQQEQDVASMPWAIGSAVVMMPPKDETHYVPATAESVPLVQAVETFMPPLVPAMYVVEEVTPVAPPNQQQQQEVVGMVGSSQEAQEQQLDAHSHSHVEHAQHDESQNHQQNQQQQQTTTEETILAGDIATEDGKRTPPQEGAQ